MIQMLADVRRFFVVSNDMYTYVNEQLNAMTMGPACFPQRQNNIVIKPQYIEIELQYIVAQSQ